MSLTVTLNVFSGRPNPVWTIPEGAAAELSERMSKITSTSNLKPPSVIDGLGYRGFLVSPNEATHAFHISSGIVDPGHTSPTLVAADRDIEKWLLSTAKGILTDEIYDHVAEALKKPANQALMLAAAPAAVCAVCKAADAPVYNPGMWNVPGVQPFNNCYNYANNHITNTFAQPGRGTGKMYTQLTKCAGAGSVVVGAQSDGLVITPNFTGKLTPGKGWYVAVVLWPGNDYHWYRQDKVGCWSHKPGSTAARNVDNVGNSISDPKTANRGPYTTFCSYMITKSTVKIN